MISGMHVTYNMKNPVGSRVQSVEVRCADCHVPVFEPINPDKQYTVILSKYIALGGDQYKMIQEGIIKSTDLSEYSIDETLDAIVCLFVCLFVFYFLNTEMPRYGIVT